jgi:hypothetical protein
LLSRRYTGMPTGNECPRIVGAGIGWRPWRVVGAGTRFCSRVRA